MYAIPRKMIYLDGLKCKYSGKYYIWEFRLLGRLTGSATKYRQLQYHDSVRKKFHSKIKNNFFNSVKAKRCGIKF